ncbi:MAG: hypothetical protein A2X61_14350 [Ignavibacteria bacterium GWB2_35_12]|nr:MAG: hypothetical protein A2X63_04500 [Ignavibacteria bacterium GWA2_35_8]OGU41085.1 MAG: hypothetical protein A2X61_14350 [Ignavibacteria bacterium GWB2_35_12]OGU86212.1 MAG: hypothetical protein A2220_14195 [Ignavibacteria bacterium RIFOXYA2_FULL_35_10]OGV22902.1 MAG: hypothetical protein A2475_10515 [Ignavibacteria bacterium RIFOXYC2_FULL_35_21]
MKNIEYCMKFNYNVEIRFMPDGIYCAEIKDIPGLAAYGNSMKKALDELEKVKRVAFEIMLSQNKEIPLPKVKLEIPIHSFEKLSNKKLLQDFVIT